MEIVSEESSLHHQRPETSHGNAHPVENDLEIHLPMVMVQEFQRLASTVNIDYYDFQELLGLSSEGAQDITTSSFSYFISEVIRKIVRLQSQPHGGGGGDGDYEYDETEVHRKKKKDQIKKHEKKLLSKVTLLDEDIQKHLTVINQQQQGINNHKNENKMINQSKLMKNYYKEKQQKHILEEFIESQNKKIKILIIHIEKLVKTLKIESNKKIKISEEYHILRKEEIQLKDTIHKQNQIHSIQSR